MDGLYSTTHPLPMFHDGLPLHIHQRCSSCLQVQRSHASQLSTCGGCGVAKYCSKACQVAHRPAHKAECNGHKAERLHLAEKTGMESAYADLTAWIQYYDAPLRNCALACMRLPENPHMERDAFFCVALHHTGDLTLPIHNRFVVLEISRRGRDEIRLRPKLSASVSLQPKACNCGKAEFGKSFYGCILMHIASFFGPDMNALSERVMHFHIDKTLAKANIARQDWSVLLREYVELGAKMHFKCGKVPGAEDICCCGGWVHEEEKRRAFTDIGKKEEE
ncbi:hypothetical protein R3P38DRAFT_3307753 [Favolaschia claudopus]|uniref:MYND-type domain-containing protein n=1 Tax=Favolaschia claudopus TaxID=2862362 RepID=A0AAW0D3T9_9AGAR